MTYVTQGQLTDRYGAELLLQLADRAVPPAGAVDAAVVARALADTDAVIDGYLAGRYVLPLAAVPPLLIDVAAAIAIYKLHIVSPEGKITDDYKDAVASLGRIATGVIRLPAAGIEPAPSGASGVEATDRERDMTPDNLSGFI